MNTDFVQAAYPIELKILSDAARKRVAEAMKAQDYYDGNFWNYIEWARDKGTIGELQAKTYYSKAMRELDYEPTKLELGYPKFFIDELASWMFENPISLQGDEAERDAALLVHRQNMLDEKLLQSAVEGCLTGGVAVKVLYGENGLRVIPRPSRECFPLMNADDVDLMEKVSFCALQDDESKVWKQTFELREGVCYVTEAIYKIESLKNRNPIPWKVIRPNEPLYNGEKYIDFIPVVLIPNEPNLGDVWGESDLKPLYDPINEICRKYSDFADALAFEMFPITVFSNCNWSKVKKPEIKPGAFFNLQGADPEHPADAKKLESSISSKESVDWFVNQLINCLHQFSGVPNITRDKIDSMGTMSGLAVKLMYSSIISKCSRKLTYWEPRLLRVYDQVLRSLAVYEGFPYRDDYKLTVETHSRVPQNEKEELEILAMKIEMLVIGVIDAMKSLGEERPEEKLAAILAEKGIISQSIMPDAYGAAIQREAGEGDSHSL